jgi:hypothetical protein
MLDVATWKPEPTSDPERIKGCKCIIASLAPQNFLQDFIQWSNNMTKNEILQFLTEHKSELQNFRRDSE